MPYRNDFDLSTITAAVVVMSDRVLSGERPNGAGEACRDRLLAEGLGDVSLSVVPELAQSLVEVERPGVAELIRAHGAEHSPLAPLSREVVGVTGKEADAALLICSPGSKGGMSDTLDVLVPLLRHVYIQLAES